MPQLEFICFPLKFLHLLARLSLLFACSKINLTNNINWLYYNAIGRRVTSITQKQLQHKKTKSIFCLKILDIHLYLNY